MGKIKVLLVDDHPVVRAGLRASVARDPSLEVVGEAADGIEALQLVEELAPDVVVMDVNLPRLDGIQATKAIRALHPETAVVILSIYDQDGYVRRARQAGAAGYLTKDVPAALICHTVKAVHRREAPLASTSRQTRYQSAFEVPEMYHHHRGEPTQRESPLTPREMEVLKLLMDGSTNKVIASLLCISHVTAKKHVQSIIGKLDASDRTEAAVKAARAGLLDG